MNELSIIFNKMGIDTKSVLEAAGTKWNFLNFRLGLVGGHCIGVAVNSVPIYYGNPTVVTDFRAECMVRIKNKDDVKRAINAIIALDKDDERYLQVAQAPCLTHESPDYYFDKISAFLKNIFEQPLDEARRLVDYGIQPNYRV